MHDLRYAPQWRPAYVPASVPLSRPALAQVQPTVVYQESEFERIMSSPTVALGTDIALVGVGSVLAFHLGNFDPPSGWSTFWWAVVTMGVVKGLHDIKRLSS